ncbi:MAG: thiamine phosphate synthase [Anaerotruncus sp.]|nr:thiamine phosphate synthase [Anaerotruncus sp.]
MKLDKSALLLYLVTDRSWLHGQTLSAQVEQALQAGVTFVQLREKSLDMQAFLTQAKQLRALCTRYQVPFVINDNLEVARACGADGVHLGQEDLEAGKARALLGADQMIGVSANSVEQALAAERAGADYLGVGAMFGTTTKLDADAVSYETLQAICRAVSIPVVAIGGIGAQNILQLKGSGIDGVAVVSAILAQPDIFAAAKQLHTLAQEMIAK